MARPCCPEMICTMRTVPYPRVPGCLVPLVWTCTFWCCAKVYHLHLSTVKHEVALGLLAQLKRYKHHSSFHSLCLYLFVQGAMTCTRDDQAVAWNPCFISIRKMNSVCLHCWKARRGSASASLLCAVTITGFIVASKEYFQIHCDTQWWDEEVEYLYHLSPASPTTLTLCKHTRIVHWGSY